MSRIKVPKFSDDMKSISFEIYKIIGKNYFCNKKQESAKFETITYKIVSTNSKKKFRFSIFEQPFNFCFFTLFYFCYIHFIILVDKMYT